MESAVATYLLESHLYDSMSVQKFKEFFPSRSRFVFFSFFFLSSLNILFPSHIRRDNPDLKILYKEFQSDRKRKREIVRTNIEAKLEEILEETLQVCH